MALRLGIVGFGRIGRRQLACAMALERIAVAAVADPYLVGSPDVPVGVQFRTDWKELVADPSISALSVCTPHHLHGEITRAAIEAGKHVLVEKPLALTVREGEELIELAHRRSRVLMVELTHRFYPPVGDAVAMIRSGRLGRILAVEERIIEPIGDQIHGWMTRKATAGGGVAITNGIHMLDRIAAVVGRPLRFVSGLMGHTAKLGDVEDTVSMLLSTDNGVPVQLLAAWRRGGGPCDDELTIYGDKGTLRVWAWRGWQFEPLARDEAVEKRECYLPSDHIGTRVRVGVTGALREFVTAIAEHRQPVPSAQDALSAQQLVELLYQNTQCGGLER